MTRTNEHRSASTDLLDIARSASPYALLQQALERQRRVRGTPFPPGPRDDAVRTNRAALR